VSIAVALGSNTGDRAANLRLGAAGLAAAYAGRGALTGKRIVLILTGANITEDQLTAALEGEPLITLEQAIVT
jgi:threonine dehydratase